MQIKLQWFSLPEIASYRIFQLFYFLVFSMTNTRNIIFFRAQLCIIKKIYPYKLEFRLLSPI